MIKIKDKTQNFKLNSINQIKINLVSPEKIKNWTRRDQLFEYKDQLNTNKIFSIKQSIFGEIRNPLIIEEINGKETFTHKGLFCEQVFGPLTNFKCLCNKPIIIKDLFLDCKICNITNTVASVRKYRTGYIPLYVPIYNSLFFLSSINFSNIFLGLSKQSFSNLIYFDIPKKETDSYIELFEMLIDTNNQLKELSTKVIKDTIKVKELVLKKEEYEQNIDSILSDFDIFLKKYLFSLKKNKRFSAYTSINENIFNFLDTFNLLKEIKLTVFQLNKINKFNFTYKLLTKKHRILENFIKTKTKLSWVMFKAVPVIPPSYRPYNAEDEDDSKASKLNILYQNIIRINERLYSSNKFYFRKKKYLLLSEIRLLQESIDFLIDNNKIEKNIIINDKPMKSLSDIVKGKEGRFRKNILGKRINFSARSVIVVDPLLKINQCAIPVKILSNLFSFKITKIIKKLSVNTDLKTIINQKIEYIILKKLIKHEIIMLNRAPTLHKLGIQSFDPILTNDDAIHLHPLACSAFNADFDGDQMAVYFPLTKLSAIEMSLMLKSTVEFFLFGNSSLKMKPSQELILGLNYLSLKNEIIKPYFFGHYFNDYNDFFSCFTRKKLNMHSPIWIKAPFVFDQGNKYIKNNNKLNCIRITSGRLILNNLISKKDNNNN